MSVIVYTQRFKNTSLKSTSIKNYLHVGYIGNRPGVEKNKEGIHGLFGYLNPLQACENIPWTDTAKYVRELSDNKANIFRSVISFDRDVATEKGLITQKDWQEYAELHIREIGEKNGIDIKNLGWCGAYHNEGSHPHIHLCFWDNEQTVTKTYVSPKIANDIRVSLIKSTFESELEQLYNDKKLKRESLAENYHQAVRNFDKYVGDMICEQFKTVRSEFETHLASESGESIVIKNLFNSDEQLADITQKLFELRNKMPTSGRITYKLLPPEIKNEVDNFTDYIIKNNTQLQKGISEYIDSMCALKSMYSSLNDAEKLKAYRDECMDSVTKEISKKVVASIKVIMAKEKELRTTEFTQAQKQYYTNQLIHGIFDFIVCGVIQQNSERLEKEKGSFGFGEESERAMKEWYLKHKDKGMEH